jgi:hypothetical protein
MSLLEKCGWNLKWWKTEPSETVKPRDIEDIRIDIEQLSYDIEHGRIDPEAALIKGAILSDEVDAFEASLKEGDALSK